MLFNLEPQIQPDYELGNWFTSTHPGVLFANTLIMERLSIDKRYKLINRRSIIEARDIACRLLNAYSTAPSNLIMF